MNEEVKRRVRVDKNNPSIQRIENRCTKCGFCFKICENVVGIDHEHERGDNALCINCGQCIMNCPMGALCTKYDYKEVLNLVNDSNKKVAISVAPAIRVTLGDEFNLEPGSYIGDILPAILKK